MRPTHTIFSLCLMLLLFACTPQPPLTLPTLAVLPTLFPSMTPLPTLEPIIAAPVTRTPSLIPSPIVTPSVTVAALLPSATLTDTPSPTFTATVSPTPAPITIDYERVSTMSTELRFALRAALAAGEVALPENNMVVSAVRVVNGWAKITFVPVAVVDSGWTNLENLHGRVGAVYLRQLSGVDWRVVPREAVPATFTRPTDDLPPLAGAYRFPWRDGDTWWATQGWHEGNAIDFQPAIGARGGVVAAQAGRLTEVCFDGFQSLLMLEHADGVQTYYLHVRVAGSVRRDWLDQHVTRGQLLGAVYDSGPFQTACGRTNQAHLHFASSTRNLSLGGVLLTDIAQVASCCTSPPTFTAQDP